MKKFIAPLFLFAASTSAVFAQNEPAATPATADVPATPIVAATPAPASPIQTAIGPKALLTFDEVNGATAFFTLEALGGPADNNSAAAAILTTPPAKLADQQILQLWPGQAPLQAGDNPARDVPTITVYAPPAGIKASGAAMIVCAGGAYGHLSPREGVPTAQWLAFNGITAFVLKYRVAPYHHPAELDDAQRAIRYVRANAATWGLDPNRVGILGYSAGGHLAGSTATHFDAGDPKSADPIERVSSRPDIQVLGYPVGNLDNPALTHGPSRDALLGRDAPMELLSFLSIEQHVSKDTPPAFILHSTGDTTVPIASTDLYVAALEKNNIPFEYLRANIGKHGYGVTDDWKDQAMAWLHTKKF